MGLFDNILKSFNSPFASTDSSENRLNLWKNISDSTGMDFSKDTVSNYLDNDGATMEVPYERLKKFKTITGSEEKNQLRLLDSIGKAGKLYRKQNLFEPVSLNQLKDNDRVYLNDYYDVDNGYLEEAKNFEPDLYGALGHFKLRSKSNLEFVKTGNKLLPYGTVEHNIEDTYDFNRGSPWGYLFNAAEDAGKAKPYKVKSSWKTYPMGVIKINDDKLDTSGIEWAPMK